MAVYSLFRSNSPVAGRNVSKGSPFIQTLTILIADLFLIVKTIYGGVARTSQAHTDILTLTLVTTSIAIISAISQGTLFDIEILYLCSTTFRLISRFKYIP